MSPMRFYPWQRLETERAESRTRLSPAGAYENFCDFVDRRNHCFFYYHYAVVKLYPVAAGKNDIREGFRIHRVVSKMEEMGTAGTV